MEIYIDKAKKLATVYLSHSDDASEDVQSELSNFLTKCKDEKIFACVFHSGNGDLISTAKELLLQNYDSYDRYFDDDAR